MTMIPNCEPAPPHKRRSGKMPGPRAALCLALLFSLSQASPSENPHVHPAPEKLGKVIFPTTCNPAIQKQFERAVALLHSFAYSAAELSFKDVLATDPRCAMAHWGIAMSNFQQLWDPPLTPEGFSIGQQEIRRAREIPAGSDRERGFIEALGLVFKPGIPYEARIASYEHAMRSLAGAYKDDAEVQVFYALSLLAAASPFDATHARQKQAAEILEPLYSKYPQHPGIAHYLIHAYDNAELARKGIRAARAYSRIAPSAPHALHMPSHIFTRLGMWSDSIESNRAARLAAHREGDIGEELHAMDYLVYAYLQERRDQEAGDVIRRLRQMQHLDAHDFKEAYASTAMPIRYAVERGQWMDAAKIVPPEGAVPEIEALAVWARAMGFTRSDRAAQADVEIERLQKLETQLRLSRNEYWAGRVRILRLEAEAWQAQAQGKTYESRRLLRQAVGDEDATEKLPVTPGPIIPAREQLGELLLEQNYPDLAVKEFRAALVTAPKRRGALDGLARSTALVARIP
jgi:hypothetical protein